MIVRRVGTVKQTWVHGCVHERTDHIHRSDKLRGVEEA